MKLDGPMIARMNILSNGFANERIFPLLDELETKMKDSSGNMIWTRATTEKILGRMLATAYAKGYADCAENVGVRRLIF